MARQKKDPFKKMQPVFVKPGLLDAPTGNGLTKGDELLRRLKFELDYDPLSELVALAKGYDTTNPEKIRIASEILSYYQPKIKAIDYNPNAGETIKLNITFPDQEETHGLEDITITKASDVDNADRLQSTSNICEGS